MSENVYQRWNRISKKPKKNYIYFKVPFQRMIPLMALLIVVNSVIWGDFDDINILIVSIVKIILAYILGVLIGDLEWSYFKNLAEGKFTKASQIRNKYLFIYGFLSFGLTIMISQLDFPIKFISLTVAYIVMWPLSGLLWGSLMWLVFADGLKKYLKKSN